MQLVTRSDYRIDRINNLVLVKGHQVHFMKLMIMVICFSILVATTLPIHGAELGLASAWLFEEAGGKAVKDTVGNHHGEIKGSLKWVDDGKFGRALQFPGKGDSYVRITHHDVFNADPYTFTVWTKLKPTIWQYIVWRNGDVWPEKENVRHLDIWIHKDTHSPVFMWHVKGKGGRIEGKKAVADNKWHHTSKVYDGKTVKMYIDGKLEGEVPSGGTLDTSKTPIWIGARPGNVAATGLFDEVGFFTQALTDVEIRQVMTQGLMKMAAVEPTTKLTVIWGQIKQVAD
jgi:hypothetical protein